MQERYNRNTTRLLYAMARAISDHCPEIKDRNACRAVLKAHGFKDEAVKEYLTHVQYMARIIRGKDIDRLVKKQTDQT